MINISFEFGQNAASAMLWWQLMHTIKEIGGTVVFMGAILIGIKMGIDQYNKINRH